MPAQFSDTTNLWLRNQSLLWGADRRFRSEWSQMLQRLRSQMADRGWASRMDNGDPPDEIKLFRPHWPASSTGVHYEVGLSPGFPHQPSARLHLHIEEDVPCQAAVCSRIRQLLRPHAPRILRDPVSSMPDEPLRDIFSGFMPLTGLTASKMFEAVEWMTRTEGFVDEALALGDKTALWRTEFADDRHEMCLDWCGQGSGGQQIVEGVGRLESAALRIDGTRPNARGQDHKNGCYSVPLHPTHVISNGGEYYVCMVIRTSKEATVRMYFEGHKDIGEDGIPAKFPLAMKVKARVQPSERWQTLIMTARVPAMGEMSDELRYDFARDGTWGVLVIVTEDTEFLLDSVEIGRCS